MQRDLKVTFCQAARAARQGMGPNANVGYRRALVPFRAAVRLQLCGCWYCNYLLAPMNQPHCRQERGRYRDTCVYIAPADCACTYLHVGCRLSYWGTR